MVVCVLFFLIQLIFVLGYICGLVSNSIKYLVVKRLVFMLA